MQPISSLSHSDVPNLSCSSQPVDSGSEEFILASMSNIVWKCIAKTNIDDAGYCYTFQLNDSNERDRYHQIIRMFPALVPTRAEVGFLNPKKETAEVIRDRVIEMYSMADQPSSQFISQEINDKEFIYLRDHYLHHAQPQITYRSILNELGYLVEETNEQVYLILPDLETLTIRWAQLQERIPGLEPLNIIPGEGIASDGDFIRTFHDNKIILSDKQEFLHDHLFHIIPTICMLLERESGPKKREMVQQNTAKIFKKIEAQKAKACLGNRKIELSMMKTVLSMYIDSMTSISNPDIIDRDESEFEDFSTFVGKLHIRDGRHWEKYLRNTLVKKIESKKPEIERARVDRYVDTKLSGISEIWERIAKEYVPG